MAAKTVGTYRSIDPNYIGVGDLTTIGTTQLYPLGTVIKVRDTGSTAYGEGEAIYLKGGTNVAARSVVTILDDWTTALVAARAKGAVAVSIGAVDATTKYGWFICRGIAAAASDGVSAAAQCYIDGTSGRVDDAVVAGDFITGMITASADDTNTCLVNMVTRPVVTDADNA